MICTPRFIQKPSRLEIYCKNKVLFNLGYEVFNMSIFKQNDSGIYYDDNRNHIYVF